MPIDPSIIANSMSTLASNMPDVNALMQQQMTGMQNINILERQRRADALELEDRALAAEERAAKKQEAATIKALLPAYTYGIQTGDIAGAGSLVPPEMRGQLQPFIDALTGQSPEQVRAALIGSLASSPEGAAALGAIQRAQTAEIQLGQLDVSREDLALRRQKQALDAQGQGAWELKEGVDENGDLAFVWINPRTRQMIQADFTGGGVSAVAPGAVPSAVPGAAPGTSPIPAPLPSTDLVTPRQPAPGAPQVAPPISVAQPPAEQPGAKFRPKPKKEDEMTQEERRRAASMRYTVKNAERVSEIIDKNPAAFGQGADEFLLSLVPFGAGDDFMAFVQDADRQQLNYRMTQIVATLLRLETGAAFTKPELVTEAASFMQKYGDKPETARDKIAALQDRVSSAIGSTGRAWTPEDQAEYDAAMTALETIKDKLYPVDGKANQTGVNAIPSAAANYLRENPQLRDQFDAKYGPGAAARILGE